MKKYLPISLALVFFLSLGFSYVSPASAQSPRRFYDWSTTLEAPKEEKVLGTQTFGQVSTDSAVPASPAAIPVDSGGILQFNRYLIGGGLTPDNPFHFIKSFQENIQLTFTFDVQKKNQMRLAIAGERLDEAKKLSDEGKVAGLSSASSSYRQNMQAVAADLQSLKDKNQNIDDLVKTVEVETAKHNVVLEKVQAAVPDEAKDALEKAIEASEENIDKVADLTNRPAVPPDVVDRITALKAQGLLTEEEAAKLIGAKTRSEARGELRKYVKEGIVPEADFLRMNENVKAYYPDDFYQIHEVKRFYALKKLEQEKPDEATLARIQEFAKTYKPGEAVPPDVRKYWGPIIQLDEIQTTLRPDLISKDLFKNNAEDYKKFNEIIERYKPRPEDLAFLSSFMSKNNANVYTLPPEYQRMYNMNQTYGAQCGSGQKWFRSGDGMGYCAPADFSQDNFIPPNPTPPPTGCRGNIVSVKSQGGICSAFPSDCVPSGWTKVESCVITPGEEVGIKNTEKPRLKTNCPSNAHFVPVPFDPSGGYCVPNYTPTGEEYSKTGINEAPCPTGYHRNYAGGACLADMVYTNYNTGGGSGGYNLPPLTVNPGNYPNPYYSSQGKCGGGSRWVPEPINPAGGYCVQDNYQQSGPGPMNYQGGYSVSPESQEAACKAGGGVCVSWVNGACGCERSGSSSGSASYCKPPDRGCEAGKWWDGGSCACRDNSNYPSACSEPSGGCGSGKYWDRGTCTCATPCPAGSAWNGNTCMKNTYTGGSGGGSSCQPPQTGCPGGWFDYGSCGCKTSSSGGGYTGGSGNYTSNYTSGGCQPPSSGCPGGWYDYGSCSCRTSSSGGGYSGSGSSGGGSYPSGSSSCQPPSSGCPGGWFDWGSCSCKTSSSGSTGSGSSGGSYTPPSGYGTCGSGQYWNGSACASSSGSSGSGGSYTPPSGGSQPAPTSPPQQQQQSQPAPTSPPASNPPPAEQPPAQTNPPPAENPPPAPPAENPPPAPPAEQPPPG